MQYSLKLLSYKRELGIDSSAKLQLTAYNSTSAVLNLYWAIPHFGRLSKSIPQPKCESYFKHSKQYALHSFNFCNIRYYIIHVSIDLN